MKRLNQPQAQAAMAQFGFRVVAQGDNLDEFRESAQPMELEPGQEVITDVHLTIPVAQLPFFIPGVDYLSRVLWQQFLAPEGVEVDRVFALDSNTIRMEGHVTGTPLIPIIAAVAGLLGAAGFLIASIAFLVAILRAPEFALFLLLIFGLIVAGGALLFSSRQR